MGYYLRLFRARTSNNTNLTAYASLCYFSVKPPAKNSKLPRKDAPLVAKYSYNANPNSPLEKELSVRQKDKLKFVEVHEMNDQWWLVQNEAGERGFIPAT